MDLLHSLGIDRRLLLAKLVYFLYLGASASLFPFLSVFLSSEGVSSTHIGIILGLAPFISFAAGFVWGPVSDLFGIHKAVFLTSALLGPALVIGMLFFRNFYALVALRCGASFLMASLTPLLDNAILELLGDEKAEYGRQRLWGTAGYGVFGLVVGVVAQHYNDLAIYFYLFGGMSFLAFLSFVFVKITPLPQSGPSFLSSLKSMLKADLLFFYIHIFVLGASQGLTTSFVFVFLRSLGATPLLLGISVGINSLSELIFFFFAGSLLNRLGPAKLLYISSFAHMVRYAGYIVLGLYGNPWYVFIIDPIHCLTFACMWTASVSYVNSLAPPGLGASAQSVMNGVYGGLGFGFGTFASGVLYATYGDKTLFISFISLVGASLVIFAISQLIFSTQSKKESTPRISVMAAGQYSGLIAPLPEQEQTPLLLNSGATSPPSEYDEIQRYQISRPPALEGY